MNRIPCIACHSSTHAIYPAFNPYGTNRDNIQAMQYQGMPLPIGGEVKCEVCHKIKMNNAHASRKYDQNLQKQGTFK